MNWDSLCFWIKTIYIKIPSVSRHFLSVSGQVFPSPFVSCSLRFVIHPIWEPYETYCVGYSPLEIIFLVQQGWVGVDVGGCWGIFHSLCAHLQPCMYPPHPLEKPDPLQGYLICNLGREGRNANDLWKMLTTLSQQLLPRALKCLLRVCKYKEGHPHSHGKFLHIPLLRNPFMQLRR